MSVVEQSKKGLAALSRIFQRNPGNTVVAELHSRAIGKPLFCHADMGGQIIHAWLREPQSLAVAERGDNYTGYTTIHGSLAVIDVSGPLVSRPMGWCSPLSYEEIKDDIQSALADNKVSDIVLRLDSAGGEASQNIDIADFIASANGQKPIIAMVDDMAYSAAYAIAAACDQIWVTRTSGVGSVGVVSYHVDQSEHNNHKGIKVEFIHAGQRKVDFNPHNPLSDEARERMQSEVDRLYDMFAESVAQNRGMSIEAVKATEAGTYHGERAIEIGFADKLGTFADLLEHLHSEDYDAQAIMSRNTSSGALASEDLPKNDGAQDIGSGSQGSSAIEEELAEDAIAAEALEQSLQAEQGAAKPQANDDTPGDAEELAQDAEQEGQASEQPITAEQAEAQILAKQHAEIKAVCTAAGLPEVALDYIAAGTAVDQVRADLMDLAQTGEVEIESTQKVAVEEPTSATSNHVTAASVYAMRNQRGK